MKRTMEGLHRIDDVRLLQTQEEVQQMQQQQIANQQQQFEQNVQDLFGIGQTQANNELVGNYVNYDPFTAANTKDVNTSAFMTALCLNAMLFVVLVGGYELFRRFFPSVYSPKSSGGTSSRTRDSSLSPLSLSSPTSNSAASSAAVNINTQQPLGWVTGVARASWSTVRNSGGLDSYMFLRYIRLCFRISITSALWGMIILWPGECT